MLTMRRRTTFKGNHWQTCPTLFSWRTASIAFNHTLQLSAKTLLHPFNVGLGKAREDRDSAGVDDLLDDDDDEDEDEDEDEDLPRCFLTSMTLTSWMCWTQDEWEAIIADTAAIHETVSKLRHLAFSIV